MTGYKQNIKKVYIEPQIGFGELGGKIYSNGDFARPSTSALFWAIGTGYAFNRFTLGVRFESVYGFEGNSAGTWHNRKFHYTGINIAYELLHK